MKTPKIKEILIDLGYCDPGCCWYGSGKKNELVFDDDERGNGEKAFLVLRLRPKYANFVHGCDLKKSEKKKKFEYEKYEKISDFTEALTNFTRKYFSSFGLKRKRKIN